MPDSRKENIIFVIYRLPRQRRKIKSVDLPESTVFGAPNRFDDFGVSNNLLRKNKTFPQRFKAFQFAAVQIGNPFRQTGNRS